MEDSIFSPPMLFLSLLTSGSQQTAFLTPRSFPVSLLLVLCAWRDLRLGVGESLKMVSVALNLSPLGSTEPEGPAQGRVGGRRVGSGWLWKTKAV